MIYKSEIIIKFQIGKLFCESIFWFEFFFFFNENGAYLYRYAIGVRLFDLVYFSQKLSRGNLLMSLGI